MVPVTLSRPIFKYLNFLAMAVLTMSENRRQYSRIVIAQDVCTIGLRGKTHQGLVLDESIGGMKIGGLKLVNLVLGEPVLVSIRDEEFLCWCRSVARGEDGQFQVGLERAKPDSKPTGDRMLINTYIANEGFHFICYATSELHKEPMTVCLWNRDELTLQHKEIVSMTEPERLEQLSNPEYLAFVAAVYGRDTNLTSMQDLINFEF
jgi:hypothetical protein